MALVCCIVVVIGVWLMFKGIEMSINITQEQKRELARLKAYFPYRIVFGVLDKDTGAFEAWAKPTMHAANRLARQGHQVFTYGAK